MHTVYMIRYTYRFVLSLHYVTELVLLSSTACVAGRCNGHKTAAFSCLSLSARACTAQRPLQRWTVTRPVSTPLCFTLTTEGVLQDRPLNLRKIKEDHPALIPAIIHSYNGFEPFKSVFSHSTVSNKASVRMCGVLIYSSALDGIVLDLRH